MSLFKYVPPERVDILANLKIRFTPGDEFNDPFEITPSAKFMEDPVYFAGFIARCATRQGSKEVAERRIKTHELEKRVEVLKVNLKPTSKAIFRA
jgi:hypothetical protein